MQRTLDKLKSQQHVTIVALGDSNTEVTFHTRGCANWVTLLAEAIFLTHGSNLCTMINSGRCGSSYRDSLARLDRDVIRFQPDLVILALGLNDAGRGASGLLEFEQEVSTMIERIRQTTSAEILVRTFNPFVMVNGQPLPPGTLPGKPFDRGADRLYAQVLVRIARETGCSCVDHYSLWCDARFASTNPVADPNGLWMRMSDALHPGPLGHLVFFRELAPLFALPTHFPWEDRGGHVAGA